MTTDTEEPQNRLIAEQLGHTLDLIKAELAATRTEQEHTAEMSALRLKALEDQGSRFRKTPARADRERHPVQAAGQPGGGRRVAFADRAGAQSVATMKLNGRRTYSSLQGDLARY